MRNMRTVDDMTWGRYAFSRDILRDRVTPEGRDEMIRKSFDCGAQWAEQMRARTGTSDPFTLARDLDLEAVESDRSMTGGRVVFAQFVPDKRIEIMSDTLDAYTDLYQKQTANKRAVLFPTPGEVRALLLAHEIFHYVEEVHAGDIYTRNETIRLWKVLCFKNDSTIRAVSEIASMGFARTFTKIDCNPFILDVLLFFGRNPMGARSIYADVMEILSSAKIQEKAETN